MTEIVKPEIHNCHPKVKKHRLLELKHFCLQYPDWQKGYADFDGFFNRSEPIRTHRDKAPGADYTARYAEARLRYLKRIQLVEEIVESTASELAPWLLKGVTEGLSYECLKTKHNIPCCRDFYYKLYRYFFFRLSLNTETVRR